jgi:molybdopterin-guanine dinucleotide biosynthesis protein A
MVVGRERPEDWPTDSPVLFLADAAPGSGPLGGLATALARVRATGGDGVLAVACDMPRLSADALRWLLDQAAAALAAGGRRRLPTLTGS